MSDALRVPDRMALVQHRAWVRALAGRLLADENDVDDVEQDTWEAALTTGPREPRALRSWLGVVASRFALQRLRGRARTARHESVLAAAAGRDRPTSDVVAEADAHGHVVQAVLALEEPYRSTILLRYFEDLEVAEVARRMDVPAETVRTRLRRARERLRAGLEQEHGRRLALVLAPIGAATTSSSAGSADSAPARGSSAVRRMSYAAGAAAAVLVGAWLLTRGAGDAARGAEPANATTAAASPETRAVRASAPTPRVRAQAAAAPAEDTPAERPPDSRRPAVNPADPWIAFDLANGRPLADFVLHLTDANGERTITTGADGVIAVDRSTVLDVAPGDAAWTFARPTKSPVSEEPSLWFWRTRRVTGTVRSTDPGRPLATGSVSMSVSLPGDRAAADAAGTGIGWLMSHGLRTGRDRPAPVQLDGSGRVAVDVMAARGVYVTMTADGWSGATCRLAPDGGTEPAWQLKPTIRVLGRILDEAGEPLTGVSVGLEAAVETMSAEEFEHALALLETSGGSIGGSGDRGIAIRSRAATTDLRGIFRIDADAFGRGVVLVRLPGRQLGRADLGPLVRDVDPFELRLARSETRIAVVSAGAPFVSANVQFHVLERTEYGFTITTDVEGRLDPGWLERGRSYTVSGGRTQGTFRWEGQPVLDLDQLSKEPPQGR